MHVVSCCGIVSQPIKRDFNKKSFPKQKTILIFKVDAKGFKTTLHENPAIQIKGPWGSISLRIPPRKLRGKMMCYDFHKKLFRTLSHQL